VDNSLETDIIAGMDIYPLKFQPIYKERIWGGQKLWSFFGKELPADKKIGESWELADVGEDKSVIINGTLAGETIDSAIEKLGEAITGNADYQPPFPLLIKILDAQDVLSVQVHPDGVTCHRTGRGEPKTECWYIIDAVGDAVIYKGLKDGTTKQDFIKAIKAGKSDKLLNRVAVRPGQCHFLPAGTAHAIGAGLLIAEIQTPSDTTYRVFDWNRVDDSGKGRQLHIEDALESIHFDQDPDDLVVATKGRLVDSDMFKVDKGRGQIGGIVQITPGQMKVFIILDGTGQINFAGESVNFKKGETILSPAALNATMAFNELSQYLMVTV